MQIYRLILNSCVVFRFMSYRKCLQLGTLVVSFFPVIMLPGNNILLPGTLLKYIYRLNTPYIHLKILGRYCQITSNKSSPIRAPTNIQCVNALCFYLHWL